MLKLDLLENAREFELKGYTIRDHGTIEMFPTEDGVNEFVNFKTKSGRKCDFCATGWGFYLGPSVNSRLKKEGFKVALVANDQKQLYVMAVEVDKLDLFQEYLNLSNAQTLCWLDEWLAE